MSNIILNHDFAQGSANWSFNCCKGKIVKTNEGTSTSRGEAYACVTNRQEDWQGLEQDITRRFRYNSCYHLSAYVRASGSLKGVSKIIATLRLEYQGSKDSYEEVGRIETTCGQDWKELKGDISLNLDPQPKKIVFYIEGPPRGIDLHVKSVVLTNYDSTLLDNPTPQETKSKKSTTAREGSITLNPDFEDGTKNWTGNGCNIFSYTSMGNVFPRSGKFFVSATDRKETYNGIQQDITKTVLEKKAYMLSAVVRIYGSNVRSANLMATLFLKKDRREHYQTIAEVKATNEDWALLQGKFIVNATPLQAAVYIEGAPAGCDILVDSFVVNHVPRISQSPPNIQNPGFYVNIIQDHIDNSNGWFPLGGCKLDVRSGGPREILPTARVVLGGSARIDERYIHVSKRTESWMGPAQQITGKIKLYLTYQVSAWVKTGAGTPQNVTATLKVDSEQCLQICQTEVSDAGWHEIFGSFRMEKQPKMLEFYFHGPAPGIDLMVAGVQIFAVNPRDRFKFLKEQTDKFRKRDVILKISGGKVECPVGSIVKVRQTQNAFPFGSCISRINIDNEDLVKFFVENFNWAVFENELKWCSTEAERGKFDYSDADYLVNFCKENSIETRGHCIFWEDQDDVPSWVHPLKNRDLKTAIQNRLTGLLNSYKGKFKHYDVNNEMLHASFFRDRLGEDIQAEMFKKASQLDPSATLFVNDYHVEDGYDMNSSPEKYIQHIQALQKKGAPIGGIGVQGHIKSPVGVIVRSALDKLKDLNLPIWLTELDVSSTNEFVRADDLEIMLREAFAHPSVEGILLWGFWELNMHRENAHLMNAEGDLNEAGRRYLALRNEWLTHADGRLDEQRSFKFRGFQGEHTIEIVTKNNTVLSKTFVVDKGHAPLSISIVL